MVRVSGWLHPRFLPGVFVCLFHHNQSPQHHHMNTFSKILAVIIDFYLVACIVIVTLIILAIALLGAEFEISISFPTLKRLLQLFS